MTNKDNIEYWLNEVHQGDARKKLEEMPDESVDMVVTSPPYYGLRDYGDDVESIWGGEVDCEHEWGTITKKPRGGNNTEENPPDVGGNEHTQETRLRGGDGIESNYCSKCGAWKGQLGLEPSPHQFVKNITEICDEIYRVLKPAGSFYLNLGDTYAGGGGVSGKPDDWEDEHNDDIYPDSVPARNVEFPDKCKMLIPHRTAISLIDNGWICRNDNIWYKPNPMPESVTDRRTTAFEIFFHFTKNGDYYYNQDEARTGTGANQRDVFEVNVASYSDAHFAVFPSKLIKPFIQSSCSEDGVVLDPFIGSGTTAVVAEQLGRDWIGIDLNKDYVEMSYDRIDDETKRIFDDRSVFDY